MTRELLILRHGKSDWSKGLSDYDRPLKKRGRKGAQRIGRWLAARGLIPDEVYSSSAERAIATAERCVREWGWGPGHLYSSSRFYLAEVDVWLSFLGEVDDSSERVMLVGHNPGLEELITHLLGKRCPETAGGKLLPTATLARIALPDNWHGELRGRGTLLDLIRARQLDKAIPTSHSS